MHSVQLPLYKFSSLIDFVVLVYMNLNLKLYIMILFQLRKLKKKKLISRNI